MVIPCASFNLVDFVDREEELEFLLEKASHSIDQSDVEKLDSAHKRVVHLVGKSNVGKSFLLCKYHNHIVNLSTVKSVILSFEDYQTVSGEQFAVQVLNFLFSCIANFLGIQPPDNDGKSAAQISNMFFKELDTLQRSSCIVFLMDEVNTLTKEQVESLETYFLEDCLSLPNTVLILSGRYALKRWKVFPLRPVPKVNVIELLGFDVENTRKQIETLNPQAEDLTIKIHEIGGGSPGNNKMILNYVAYNPLRVIEGDAVHACNKELYDALEALSRVLPQKNAMELLPALQALCILQDFDKEYEPPVMLDVHNGLNGDWDVRRTTALLNILFEIQVGPGKLVDWDGVKEAYAIEEQCRFNLEQELKLQNTTLWKTLHCTAKKMYAQWADEYPNMDIFEKKSNYHKSRLVEAGFDPQVCD
jgi:hypothetical protein